MVALSPFSVLPTLLLVLHAAVYAAAPARFDGTLARVKDWIERQHAELTAVILAIIGIMLLVQGIHSH